MEHLTYLLQFFELRLEKSYLQRMKDIEKLVQKYPNSKIFRQEPKFVHVKMHLANDMFGKG